MKTMRSVILSILLVVTMGFSRVYADSYGHGIVTDESGQPLAGVVVSVKGTNLSTVTNASGSFSFPSSFKRGELIFSYVGFKTLDVNYADNMKIVMREDNKLLGEVVVTTQKRIQSSVDVPVAVSAISGVGLQQMHIQQMDEMAQYIPGLQVQLQSPNNPSYVIRGVTSDDGASYTQPRISVFQDGVSISRSRASVVELFDMARVEVVKGPQGTLFGRGAEIGAMHFIRQKPVDYFTGELTVNYGTHNQRGVSGFLNTPIIAEKLSNRFAFSYDAHDGYIKNLSGGRLNGKSAIALRNSTRLFAGEKSYFDLVLDYQYDNYPGTSFKSNRLAPDGSDTSPFTAASLERGKHLGIKRHVGGVTFLGNHELSNELYLSTITGFRAFKSNENFDADGTYLPMLDCEENEKGTQFSHEIRLNYNKNNFSGFVGASYFYENSQQQCVVRSNLQSLYPAYAYKAFAAQTEPQIQKLASQLPAMLPAAYQSAISQLMASLLAKWFPSSYDLKKTPSMATTPDFYGDVKNALATYHLSLDDMLASLGAQGQTILTTLKKASALPLSTDHYEEGTNYGINQAAEVFADGTLKVAKGLSFTAGLRGTYEHQRTGYESSTVTDPVFGSILYQPSAKRVYASGDYYSWVGRLIANYLFAGNNAYVSLSRGRRPGVIAFNNSADNISRLKPEIIWSYEAGLKGALLKNTLNYEFSVYYYDWSHFQTMTLTDSSSSIARVYKADDAGKAHSFGFELNLRYALSHNLSVFTNYGYIDGKFNQKDENGNEQEYAGHRFRLTPKNTFSAGLDAEFAVGKATRLYLRPAYTYKSKVFFEDDNDPLLTQEGYGIVNANIGLLMKAKDMSYDFSFFAKNAFDKKYIIDAGNSGNQIGFPTFIAGCPSVFGAQLRFIF
jgi:iron complex outermembrane receptor protein